MSLKYNSLYWMKTSFKGGGNGVNSAYASYLLSNHGKVVMTVKGTAIKADTRLANEAERNEHRR